MHIQHKESLCCCMLCIHRALESELLEKDVVHEYRLKELFGDKVTLSNHRCTL
jgi:hypothetical protein